MPPELQSAVRAILKIGGGVLIAKGWGDGNTVEVIAAGAAAAIGVVWGLWHRTPAAPSGGAPPKPPANDQ